MSNNAIAQRDDAFARLASRLKISPEKLELVRQQIAPGAPPDVLELFFERCRVSGFDPFGKMLYCIPRQNKQTGRTDWTMQVSIDGFRSIAEDSGEYDGQDEPKYKFDERSGRLVSATVTVYRKGMTRGISSTADWAEYGSTGPMWVKMPKTMLAKVAEAAALRKAFPKKLQGIYSSEEMDQAARPPVAVVAPVGVSLPADKPAALPQQFSVDDIKRDIERLYPGEDWREWLEDHIGVSKTAKSIKREQKQAAREMLDAVLARATELTTAFEEAAVEFEDAQFVDAPPVEEKYEDPFDEPAQPTLVEPPPTNGSSQPTFAERAQTAMLRGRARDAAAKPVEDGLLL